MWDWVGGFSFIQEIEDKETFCEISQHTSMDASHLGLGCMWDVFLYLDIIVP